jgi:hypothetical protein
MEARVRFAHCLEGLEAAVKACVDAGGDPEQCKIEAIGKCKEEASAFLADCLKSCQDQPPPPEPPTCLERCDAAAAHIKQECIDAGGSEEECAAAVGEFLARCKEKCNGLPPGPCDIDCEKAAAELKVKCIAAGISEEECAKRADEFLAHCRDRVAEHCRAEQLALSFAPHDFIRGDSNTDGKVNVSDPITTLNFLFLGLPGTSCLDAADANDDGLVDISDAVAVLQRLFLGGGPLPEPTRVPGPDPTADGLICE